VLVKVLFHPFSLSREGLTLPYIHHVGSAAALTFLLASGKQSRLLTKGLPAQVIKDLLFQVHDRESEVKIMLMLTH
jgi:hypothetical protein